MNDDRILNTINDEIVRMTPSNFDLVKSKCSGANTQKENIIVMKKNNYKKFISVAAAFAVIISAIFAFYLPFNKVDSIIDIDVNPAISIKTNRNEKIIDIDTLNEDGKIVIGNMDLKGVDLQIAINALIGSMLKNGYITDTQNTVLVSVSNKNADKQQKLLKNLSEDIDGALKERNVEGAVLTQSLKLDEDTSSLARKYNISEGKAVFINYILAENPKLSYDSLAGLSISELALMIEPELKNSANVPEVNTSSQNEPATTVPNTSAPSVSLSGEINKAVYIGEDKAVEAALRDALLSKENASYIKVKFDQDNGVLVYDVEFSDSDYEYEYEINAITGAVEGKDKELAERNQVVPSTSNPAVSKPSVPTTAAPSQPQKISEAKAKEIALNKAGVKADSIKNYTIKSNIDDGIEVYDISFVSKNVEYEIEINARNGKIRDFDREYKAPVIVKPESTTSSNADSYISKENAKKAALSHAKISADKIKGLEIELDKENGKVYYEVSFVSGRYEYEYKINAVNGAVMFHEKEIND